MTPEIKRRIEQIQNENVPDGYKKLNISNYIVPADWSEIHMDKLFKRLTRKNTVKNTNVLTISAQHGLINQQDFFNKTVASEDKSNYFLLQKGDFAYNKSYSTGYPFGAVKVLEKYESGIVSPLYICFEKTEKNKCSDYYLHYFEGGFANREIRAFAQEGARNHGLLNIAAEDFFNMSLVCPPLPEQQKISKILYAQDKVIALKQNLLQEKKQQKKYLMQKLLSADGTSFMLDGVKINKSEWKKEKLKNLCEMSSGSTPKRDHHENFSGNISWLTSGELKHKYIFDTLEKISEQAVSFSNLRIYEKGTVVIAIYGLEAAGIRGTCSILSTKTTISQACMAFTNFKKISNEFFYYWYLFNGQIIGIKYAQGTKQQNLSVDLIGNLMLPIPSLPEQQVIAKVLSAADKEIELLQKSIEQEKQKKKALMQLLLTGIVRVKIYEC